MSFWDMSYNSESRELWVAKSYSKMYWVEFTKFGILGFWAASSLPTAFASMSWDVCTKDEYVYSFC